jgi:hypothetical protein
MTGRGLGAVRWWANRRARVEDEPMHCFQNLDRLIDREDMI